MRAIEFRVFIKETKEMLPVTDLSFVTKEVGVSGCYEANCLMCTDLYNFDDVVLMPYIGRKDEDDIDIAKNDIVQVLLEHFPMGYYQEVEYVGVVKYDTDICAYYLDLIKPPALSGETIPKEIDGIKITREDPEDFDTRFYFDASVDSAAMTVIGNIHENPELLEGK
ncbi:YopX family protein [Listeria marthii]|uniref:YopX family protein n=1 Tax=Listeria marthii TaxID=529731 RepID=UPI0016259F51|nr:YopX family protein [Listeria marthii]MBC2038985.1 hypothetical protein [Listeria marthii]